MGQVEPDSGPTLGSPVINSSTSHIWTLLWRHRHALMLLVIINSTRNISWLTGCMRLRPGVTSCKEKQQFAYNNKHDTHMLMHRWRHICTRSWLLHAGSRFLTYPQSFLLTLVLVYLTFLLGHYPFGFHFTSVLSFYSFLSSSSACCTSPLPLSDAIELVIKMLKVNWANYCTAYHVHTKLGPQSRVQILIMNHLCSFTGAKNNPRH